MKTVAIIQARMGSSRLPGKVLLDLAGKPMIQRVIERAQRAQTLDAVVIATTTDAADSPVALLGETLGVPVARGSLHDVLDRYYRAAQTHQAEIIVRLTADCPLMDANLIDNVICALLGVTEAKECASFDSAPRFDFACNRLPPPFTRSFPIGLDVEACTFPALQRAWREASQPFQREHVMPYLYENVHLTPRASRLAEGASPRGFRVAQLHHQPNYGSLRWTVDTPADLAFMRAIYARLPNPEDFTWSNVLEIVQKEPALNAINAAVRHKTMTETDRRAAEGQ